MSYFTKARSHSIFPGFKRRYRERKYPWLYKTSQLLGANSPTECEACKKPPKWAVWYESGPDILDLQILYVCDAHEKLCKTGKWSQVFGDMDRKIERGQNGL